MLAFPVFKEPWSLDIEAVLWSLFLPGSEWTGSAVFSWLIQLGRVNQHAKEESTNDALRTAFGRDVS